jgi:DNA-binding MarR family transcriptional regulator
MGSHDYGSTRPTGGDAVRTARIRAVMNALRHIVRDLRLSAREAERSAGVSGAQLFVLQALADERAASLNDLAERTHTDQSSVSVVVRRLAEQKLISRRASDDDARRTELRLTAAGRRLIARCPEPTQARLVAALERIAPPELDGLIDGLTALAREMGGASGSPPMFFEPGESGDAGARARAEEQ